MKTKHEPIDDALAVLRTFAALNDEGWRFNIDRPVLRKRIAKAIAGLEQAKKLTK